MPRIVVVGTSGSGKTTLAAQLARKFKIPHIEVDALNWAASWVSADADTLRKRVTQATSIEDWVIDGNYKEVRDLLWARATMVVWLDYPQWLVVSRVIRRTIRRIITKENLWDSGNRETWRMAFLSRDSIIWWSLTTYKRRKRDYPILFAKSEYAHIEKVRLCSPKATQRWLDEVNND